MNMNAFGKVAGIGAVLALSVIVGCGDSDSTDDNNTTTQNNTSGQNNNNEPNPNLPSDCGTVGFTADEQGATSTEGSGIVAQFDRQNETSVDYLLLTVRGTTFESFGPGTYEIQAENFADCELCVLVTTNCAIEGDEETGVIPCETEMFAQSGVLEITEYNGTDSKLVGELRDVVAYEIEIDEESGLSTLVEGGQTYCIPSFEIDTEVFYSPAGE